MKPCILVMALAVGGCVTGKLPTEMSYTEMTSLVGELEARCVEQGVVRGSAEMDVCFRQEGQREITKRVRGRVAAAQISRAVGEGLKAYGRSQQRRTATIQHVGNTSFVYY